MTDGNNESGKIVDWIEDRVPVSRIFADPYFSKMDGRAETAHVFVRGNDLPDRWRSGSSYIIAELGFGTGLNFLETFRQFRVNAPDGARMDFVSFEIAPLDVESMKKAHSRWPELLEIGEPLYLSWLPDEEMQRVEFGDDVALTVFSGDANWRLPRLEFEADAWYLDGFSPARNPELWSLTLMQSVFDHTRSGGTLATYTAAGWVRRNLEKAGFEVEKKAGFANKRHMLRARKPF